MRLISRLFHNGEVEENISSCNYPSGNCIYGLAILAIRKKRIFSYLSIYLKSAAFIYVALTKLKLSSFQYLIISHYLNYQTAYRNV